MFQHGLPFAQDKALVKEVLSDLKEHMLFHTDENAWWNGVKEIGEAHGFAISNKDYKANPEKYKGSVSDCAEILRVAITGSTQSPNLHEILEILGEAEVKARLEEIVA